MQAVFEAALPTSLTDDLGTQVLATLVGAGVLVTLVGALLAVWVARASLRPLSRAAETASLVSQSSLQARIDYDGADDAVGRLVSSINEMLDRLESAFGEQRRFTADASHELRTPLAVIAGHVEFIRDSPLSEDERREELELIADEVARMGRLVDDLLALARLDAASSGTHQPLEVSSLLEEAAARGRGLGDRRIGVETPGELWVAGDPDQLMQALLNLVGNAVAHTQSGGSIRLAASATGETVRVEVDDDRPRHARAGPVARLRPLLPCPRTASGRLVGLGPRPRDHGAPDPVARRADLGSQPRHGRRHVHDRVASHPGAGEG